jgi:hypothetical protein
MRLARSGSAMAGLVKILPASGAMRLILLNPRAVPISP